MAGPTVGAPAPVCTAPGAPLRRTLYRVPASSRTRRLAGVCLVGELLVSIYSTRRDGMARGVSITLQGSTASESTEHMSPAEARALAHALVAAAGAADGNTHGEG